MAGGTVEQKRNRADFEVGEWVGDGSFGYVTQCTDKSSGAVRAQKVVNLGKVRGVVEGCRMEAHCLRRMVGSEYVPALHCIFETPHEWVAVIDLYTGGELWSYVKNCGCVDAADQGWLVPQLARAVAAIHAAGIVHRDLKCENFMLDAPSTRRVRLIDFGTCRDTKHPEVKPMVVGAGSEHHVGTPNFMAPEAVEGKGNDFKSDLWSLGCCIAQLLTGCPPFAGPNPFFILYRARRVDLWLPSFGIAPEAKDLVLALVRKTPEERLGATSCDALAILGHHYVSSKKVDVAPVLSAESQALSVVGRCLWQALGPEEEASAHGMAFPDQCVDDTEEVERARRKDRASQAFNASQLELNDIAAATVHADKASIAALSDVLVELAALPELLEPTDVNPGLLPAVRAAVGKLNAASSGHVLRFVEQSWQLRRDIESPQMPEVGDDDDHSEAEDDKAHDGCRSVNDKAKSGCCFFLKSRSKS